MLSEYETDLIYSIKFTCNFVICEICHPPHPTPLNHLQIFIMVNLHTGDLIAAKSIQTNQTTHHNQFAWSRHSLICDQPYTARVFSVFNVNTKHASINKASLCRTVMIAHTNENQRISVLTMCNAMNRSQAPPDTSVERRVVQNLKMLCSSSLSVERLGCVSY